jgi:replication factor C subunit 1
MPFMKASNVVAPAKATKEMPDLEEAIEESDSGEVLVETPEDNEDEDMDISKDKYIKKPKAKKATVKKPAGKKAKKNDGADGNEGDSQDEVKPKKPRASKPKATGAKIKAKK